MQSDGHFSCVHPLFFFDRFLVTVFATADLPNRFVFEDLQKETFKRKAQGCSATCQRERLCLDAACFGGDLDLTATVDGALTVMARISAAVWPQAARIFAGCKETLDREAKRRFESKIGVAYSCGLQTRSTVYLLLAIARRSAHRFLR